MEEGRVGKGWKRIAYHNKKTFYLLTELLDRLVQRIDRMMT